MARILTKAILSASLLMPATALTVFADPPSILNMFQKKSAAVAEQKLELAQEHGPWMILAMTLSGDDAEAKAIALAQELRRTVSPDVYVHHKEFDYTQTLGTGKREREPNKVSPLHARYANATRERTYAVLVGNFLSVDDPRVPDMLQKIRTAQPRTLSDTQNPTQAEAEKSNDSGWLVAAMRVMSWKKSAAPETRQKGPMGAAFITRNPLLPDEFFQRVASVDDFVTGLNQEIGDEKIEHSLLKCPGRYTVRVASFRGFSSTQVETKSKSENSDPSDQLNEAALQAHKLTLALRKRGEEAYEFHDRYGSYVTIGSFDTLGSEGPDRTFAYHPQIVEILQKWCGFRSLPMKDPKTGLVSNVASANSLDKIPFDIEGKPISVPKASTSKLYQGSLLGKQRINP